MPMTWSPVSDRPIHVTVLTERALMDEVETRLSVGQGFSVATLNLDHAVKLAHDRAFAQAYAAHTHVTADGNPVVWLSRLSGQAGVELVPGSELILPMAEMAARLGVPVGLFGSTNDSLEAAKSALQSRFPGLAIPYCVSPPMGFDPDGPVAEEAIAALKASGARLVFLALGAPKQERFAARAQEQLRSTGFLSIGAGLDFISGRQNRAPKWVQAIAAEWLWRMLGNPARLAARYGACILALPRLTLSALRARSDRGAA